MVGVFFILDLLLMDGGDLIGLIVLEDWEGEKFGFSGADFFDNWWMVFRGLRLAFLIFGDFTGQ